MLRGRTVNLKGFLLVVLILGVMGAGVHLLHGAQVRRNASTILRQADRAEEEGDQKKTLQFLNQYLGMRPKDEDARRRQLLLLCQLIRKPRELQNVYYGLDQFLLNNPDDDEIRRKSIEVARQIGKNREARLQVEALLKNQPNDIPLLEQLAGLNVAETKYDSAVKVYEKITRLDTKQVDSYYAQAMLLRERLDKAKEANAVIQKMKASNPQSQEANWRVALYQVAALREPRTPEEIARRIEARQELEKLLASLLEKQPEDKNADALLLSAELALQEGERKEARTFLERGLKSHPGNLRFVQELARLELAEGNKARATTLLKESDPLPSGNQVLLAVHVELLVDVGEVTTARKLLGKLPANEQTAGTRHYLEARMLVAEEKWLEALKLLDRARGAVQSNEDLAKRVYLLQAICHLQLSNPDLALADCQSALTLDSTWPLALRALADIQLALGRYDEAINAYQKIRERFPEVNLSLARARMARTARQPRDQQNWSATSAEVERLLGTATKDEPWSVMLTRIELALASKDRAGADKLLESAKQAHPKETGPWLIQVNLAVADKDETKANTLLDQADKALGDRSGLWLARLRLLSSQKKDKEARTLRTQYRERESQLSEADRPLWLRGQFDYLASIGERDEAAAVLARLGESQPKNLGLRVTQFDVAMEMNDRMRAKQIADELRTLEGEDGVFWRYAEASLLLTDETPATGSLSAAKKLLEDASKRRPNWSKLNLLRGLLVEQQGNITEAIREFEKVILQGQPRTDVTRRLLTLYMKQGRYADAQTTLLRLRDRVPQDTDFLRMEAELSLYRGAKKEQILSDQLLKQLEQSSDYRDHLWLGQVKIALRDEENAKAAFTKAIQLNPQRPEPRVALILLLVSRGEREEAKKLTELAARELPIATNQLALATCYEAIGQQEKSESLFRASLERSPDDPISLRANVLYLLRSGGLKKARPLFDEILKANTPGKQLLVPWARRLLALSLAANRDVKETQEAFALIERNLKEMPSSTEDLRAKALIQAQNSLTRREALRNLEKARSEGVLLDEEVFLLARLHLANNNSDKAVEVLRQLLDGKGKSNPQFVTFYTDLLITKKAFAEAEFWIKQLEESNENPLRVVGLKASLAHAQGNKSAVFEISKQFVQTKPKDLSRQLSVALLLDQLGYSAEAEPYHRAFAQEIETKDPRSLLYVLRHLAQRNKQDEALDIWQRLQGKLPDRDVAAAGLACLRAGSPEPRQIVRVLDWVNQNLSKQMDPLPMQLILADLKDLQGKPVEAIELYRQILRRKPDHPDAANNLAFLLAMRKENLAEAKQLMDNVLQSGLPEPAYLDTRAVVAIAAGDTAAAMQDLEQCLSARPTGAAYFHLAQAQWMKGLLKEAQASMQKAHEMGLKATDLHPLEVTAYDKLRTELNRKVENRPGD